MGNARFFVGVKALIRNKKGRILVLQANTATFQLTKTPKPFYDLPGGRIQPSENVEEALGREVKEELGISPKTLGINQLFDASVSKVMLPNKVGVRLERVPLFLVTFLCDLTVNERFKLSDEHIGFAWVDAKRAKKLLAKKFNSAFLKKLNKL
ncbi:MAG: NUDIX hydrolase [Candidatus Marsarchaeota archaeon]|nr:NUDIX hydrolase [Candidatus Marsarchaeota archaeon]